MGSSNLDFSPQICAKTKFATKLNLIGVVCGGLSSEDELQDDEDGDAVQEGDEVQEVEETPQPQNPRKE